MRIPLILCILSIVSTQAGSLRASDIISLAGEWRFAMGGEPQGKSQDTLPELRFADTIQLPGTTETRGKGEENPARESGRLTRVRHFDGTAWYQRDVTIPETWKGKRTTLFLERTKYTQVWLDEKFLGNSSINCTPQEYALGEIAPGTHRLTILVDNRDKRHTLQLKTHQHADDTQTNWNGLLGRLELQATDPVSIEDVQVYPDVAKRALRVRINVTNATGGPVEGSIALAARSWNTSKQHVPPSVQVKFSAPEKTCSIETEYILGPNALLWDEFSPALYTLAVKLDSKQGKNTRKVDFGLREFKTLNGQFTINGRPTFLRGKNDACVFPLTGHPPMDVDGWMKHLQICKNYGINYIRCHTWTPPEAALMAADRLGIYFQPELPFWGAFSSDVRNGLMPEATRILKTYGNHPSFVMLSLGNELTGSTAEMGVMVKALRALDPRPLYAQGSNNVFWDPNIRDTDDYWAGHRTRTAAGVKDARGSYSTAPQWREIGAVQKGPASTRNDLHAANAGLPIPVIGHETGQFTVYPDFSEISKYKGVTRARNFEIVREKLAAKGMADQAESFVKASGVLCALCYREEIEMALRTPGWGGFQLLDLQDFPGQGTALVGILNAFMESKGLITPEEWRQFCAPIVPLARFDKYIWTADETFAADIEVAHYGPSDLTKASLSWSIVDSSRKTIASGALPAMDVKQGNVRTLGSIKATFEQATAPGKLTLEVKLSAGKESFVNRYPLWVYPSKPQTEIPAGVTLARDFDAQTLKALTGGARVLLMPESGRLLNVVGGAFATDFWCWPMFKNDPGTMGVLFDPKHPAFSLFPTEFHSNWQWFNIVKESKPFILDATPHGFRPIAQTIDNLDRNHKLGLIFEAKIGAGRLLVCASDLQKLKAQPEARQLLSSLLSYAASERFNPSSELPPEVLRKVFTRVISTGKKATASTTLDGNTGPEKATDSDGNSRWSASDKTLPQSWQVDLDDTATLQSVEIQWEQDKEGYGYTLDGSTDGQTWKVLSDQTQNKMKGRHNLDVNAEGIRYLRLSITAIPADASGASIKNFRVIGG